MKRSAFTLIELLVVMAIIGILAGLLFPALGGVRKKARRTQSHSLVTQVETAWMVHFNDFRSFPDASYFKDADTSDKDTSFPMSPFNVAVLNWRCKKPVTFTGTNKDWMDKVVSVIDAAVSKKTANKPRNLTITQGKNNLPVSTRDAYLEIDQIQWIVGIANTWGSRAAQKGFESEGVSGATSAMSNYLRNHPDPIVHVKLDTGYDGKVDAPVENVGASQINKIAVAWVNSESANDQPIVSW